MKLETRLFHFIYQIQLHLKNKTNRFFDNKQFPISFFLIFLGFLVGNIFGTFLAAIRYYIFWDGFIICLVLGFCEIINLSIYKIVPSSSVPAVKQLATRPFRADLPGYSHSGPLQGQPRFTTQTLKFLNFFKIGLLFGFFIDAFKVGS